MAEKKKTWRIISRKGIIASRERAKTNIMAGKVFVDGQRVDKAGAKVSVTSNIEFKGRYYTLC